MEEKIEILLNGRSSIVSDRNLINLDKRFKLLIYIARALKQPVHSKEVNLVIQRTSLILGIDPGQNSANKKLTENMRLIDESIRAVKSFRSKSQLSLFES